METRLLTATANVVIIDPNPLSAEGLRKHLEMDRCIKIVAEARNLAIKLEDLTEFGAGGELIMFVNASLLHSNLALSNPRGTLEGLARKIVVYEIEPEHTAIVQAAQIGADGYISKNAVVEEYLAAVQAAKVGATFFSKPLSEHLLDQLPPQKCKIDNYNLTNRELEILTLLAHGLCNKAIANRFDLSVRTVEAHRLNIRRKTASNTVADLVRIARSLDLPDMGEAAPSIVSERQNLELVRS
ncbi:MAG: response regulator transcription factor [Rhizobiaceae bacterium]|nr:response regulator transcription factor [Rhizobiaceae bacterium]